MNSNDLFTQPETAFILTSQHNLRLYLSYGFFGQRAVLQEDIWRDDFAVLPEGRAPVFCIPVHGSIVSTFYGDTLETTFPVLTEFDWSQVEKGVVRKAGKCESLFLLCGLIPVNYAKAFHFEKEEHRANFLSSPFSNLNLIADQAKVTPEMFSGNDIDISSFESCLKNPETNFEIDLEEYRLMDRVLGAVSLACHVIEKSGGEVSSWEQILSQNHEVLKTGTDSCPAWFRHPLRTCEGKEIDSFQSVEKKLFSVVFNKVSGLHRKQGWRPLNVLSEIETEFSQYASTDEIQQMYFDKMRDLIDCSEEFKGVKEGGNEVSKALLLFLMRTEDPERLINWSQAETKASPVTMATASFISGLAHGYNALPATIRMSDRDKRLKNAISNRINSKYQHLQKSINEAPVVQENKLSEKNSGNYGRILRLFTAKEVIAGSSIEPVAIELCEKAGWSDCVNTLVSAPADKDYDLAITQIKRKRKVMAVRIPGFGVVSHELDEDRFRERLTTEGPEMDEEIFREAAKKSINL